MTCCGITVKRMGMSADSVRKMKAPIVTATPTGKGGWNLTPFVCG